MKYDVHIFTIVRVKVPGIEAGSQEEAMSKAEEQFSFHDTFDNIKGCETEWGEEHSYALVDVVGDKEYQNSMWYGPDLRSPLGPAPNDDQARLAMEHKETGCLPNKRESRT